MINNTCTDSISIFLIYREVPHVASKITSSLPSSNLFPPEESTEICSGVPLILPTHATTTGTTLTTSLQNSTATSIASASPIYTPAYTGHSPLLSQANLDRLNIALSHKTALSTLYPMSPSSYILPAPRSVRCADVSALLPDAKIEQQRTVGWLFIASRYFPESYVYPYLIAKRLSKAARVLLLRWIKESKTKTRGYMTASQVESVRDEETVTSTSFPQCTINEDFSLETVQQEVNDICLSALSLPSITSMSSLLSMSVKACALALRVSWYALNLAHKDWVRHGRPVSSSSSTGSSSGGSGGRSRGKGQGRKEKTKDTSLPSETADTESTTTDTADHPPDTLVHSSIYKANRLWKQYQSSDFGDSASTFLCFYNDICILLFTSYSHLPHSLLLRYIILHTTN